MTVRAKGLMVTHLMKRTTYIKSVAGSVINMHDGTAWEVTDPHFAPHGLPHLLPLMKVETEDVGIDKHVTILNSGQVLKARKKRPE